MFCWRFVSVGFSTKSNLKSHLYVHSSRKDVFCDQCSARFKNMDSLRKHKKTHLEKSHACSICGNRYRNRNNLKAHMGNIMPTWNECVLKFYRTQFATQMSKHINAAFVPIPTNVQKTLSVTSICTRESKLLNKLLDILLTKPVLGDRINVNSATELLSTDLTVENTSSRIIPMSFRNSKHYTAVESQQCKHFTL